MYPANAYVIRQATEADATTLRQLAELDGHKPFAGPALIAESGGAAIAAISLFDERVVADPFERTGRGDSAAPHAAARAACALGRAVAHRSAARGISSVRRGAGREELIAMPFPRDPNAPGGPGRSEFVRWTYATPKVPRPAG